MSVDMLALFLIVAWRPPPGGRHVFTPRRLVWPPAVSRFLVSTTRNEIVVVSGLPRSGTSMMMRMVTAGGIEAVEDGERQADADNPRGYFEFERVKKLKEDASWLEGARGKAVKIISFLLLDLPPSHPYKVLFMRRTLQEVLASQRQMLLRRGEPADRITDSQMAAVYEKHLKQVNEWMRHQPNLEVMDCPYAEIVADPRGYASQIDAFLGGGLDTEAMAAAVEGTLYRQRA